VDSYCTGQVYHLVFTEWENMKWIYLLLYSIALRTLLLSSMPSCVYQGVTAKAMYLLLYSKALRTFSLSTPCYTSITSGKHLNKQVLVWCNWSPSIALSIASN